MSSLLPPKDKGVELLQCGCAAERSQTEPEVDVTFR